MIDLASLKHAFQELYGTEARLFRAPGRVNLIGEHTDYNDGFVLPMAIDRQAVVAAAPRAGRRVRVFALDLGEHAEFDLDHPGMRERGIWLDYVEGVAQALLRRGVPLSGADLAITSDVPTGAGLSSSAALEVASGLALASVAGDGRRAVDRVTLALAGQEAEHTYVGAKVGIMDQLIAALGQAGHALLIDCRSLETKLIPVDTSRTLIAICDSRVKHELAASEYNTRRAECERGVELLRKEGLADIRALRDVSVEQFAAYENFLPEPVRRRCRHIVTENARTLAAAAALEAGALTEMGRLMFASHESLSKDYEVSCAELDRLVNLATALGPEVVAGARMTGGGFGGCTVNLVRRERLEDFRRAIARDYAAATGHEPHIYVSEAGEGAKEVRLNAER